MRTIHCVHLVHRSVWDGQRYLTDNLTFSKNIKQACRFYFLKETTNDSLRNRDTVTVNAGNKILCYRKNRIEMISRQLLNNEDYDYTDFVLHALDEKAFFDYGTPLQLKTADSRILQIGKNGFLEIAETVRSENSSFEILTADSCNAMQTHDWDHNGTLEITGNLRDSESKELAIARLREESMEDNNFVKNQWILVLFLAAIVFVLSYHNWR